MFLYCLTYENMLLFINKLYLKYLEFHVLYSLVELWNVFASNWQYYFTFTSLVLAFKQLGYLVTTT